MSRHTVDRLLAQGLWQSLAPGVYLTHNGPKLWSALAWAGVIAGGPQAMLAEEAAGHLWGIVSDPPGRLCLLVPNDSHPEQRWPWYFRRTRNLPRPFGSPPRTPLPHTVVDLCIAQPAQRTRLLADVLTGGRTSPAAILKTLDARRRVPGRKQLEVMLGRVREGIHSELEHLYAKEVERAHGLPRGQRQFFDGRYRTDVRCGRLIIELDGRLGHMGSGAFRDMRRDNAHLLQGNLTLRFGWDDVTQRPCEVARQVAEMLMQTGWTGAMHPCPHCRMNNGTD